MIARWPNGNLISVGKKQSFGTISRHEVTQKQQDKLEELQIRYKLSDPIQVIPGMGYIGIQVGRMFIGIEPDGHSHT